MNAYRNTPLLLLSPLARGADQLVAGVALQQRFAIPVVAPLPLEVAEYEKDFKDPRELAAFRELLNA